MRVTVAVCTWNHADLLDRTLDGLSRLRIPEGVEWELVVVDNNSDDHTDAVIARHRGRLPLRRLSEPKQGVSHARNCAVAGAAGDLLLWTDDDVLVDPEWLAEYTEAARAWPEHDFFGGTVDPWFEVDPPEWISRHLAVVGGAYALRQYGDDVRPLAPDEQPVTANMAYRLDVLKRFAFDPRLGQVGEDLLKGEDTDLMSRVVAAGHRGVWVGTARVRHLIPSERLTGAYLWRVHRAMGRTFLRQRGPMGGPQIGGAPRWAVKQYATLRLVARCLTPWKGPRWVRAFLDSAKLRGLIDESRAISRSARADGAGR